MNWARQKRIKGRGRAVATKVYTAWIRMRRRCYNRKDKDWCYYGGRGVWVCDEWRESFEAFREWAITNGIARDLTLDRIDNDDGYYPENCQWIPQSEQSSHRTMSKFTEEEVLHIRRTGMSSSEVAKRWGVRKDYASKIVSGKYVWAHLQP